MTDLTGLEKVENTGELEKQDTGRKKVHKPGATPKEIKRNARAAGVTRKAKPLKIRKPRQRNTVIL